MLGSWQGRIARGLAAAARRTGVVMDLDVLGAGAGGRPLWAVADTPVAARRRQRATRAAGREAGKF